MAPAHVFARSTEVAAPPEEVFAFHLDTRNAPLISPAAARFIEISGRFPVEEGTTVRLRVRQPPVPFAQTWVVRIDEIVANRLVVDVAERSPFAHWRHEHRFAPLGEGTLMTDHIEYRLPGGPFGRLANRLLARRMLEAMFAERHARTREHFAAG